MSSEAVAVENNALLGFTPVPTVVTGGAFVKFTPISGIHTDHGPFCYLLEVDSTKILLDVGTTPALTVDHLRALEHVRVDAVLLTHSGLEHVGGLSYLVGMKKEDVVVLATTPVHHLAGVALYEAVQGLAHNMHLPTYLEPAAIDSALSRITQVRYSQPMALPGGIIVAALPSGHSPGGTIWRIRKNGEDIYHVLRMNHRREATLDGAPLQLIHRPSLLLMDAFPALRPEAPAVKERNTGLVESIQSITKHGGNVLIPMDYERLLELLYSLKQHPSVGVIVCGFQVSSFLDIGQSVLEWMGAALMKEFERTHTNPFCFDGLTLVNNLTDLERMLPSLSAKVIISCGHAFTQKLYARFLGEKGHLIIFPNEYAQDNNNSSKTVELMQYEKVYLEGEDLRRWRQTKLEEEQQAAAEAAFVALQKRRTKITDELAELAADNDDDESEDEEAAALDVLEEAKKDKKTAPIYEEDIQSAQMLREVYWSDYRHDWHLDVHKDAAMKLWISDPEAASLSVLGGVTPGCRFQVFPIASGVVRTDKLYPSKLSNSAYGLVLDYSALYSQQNAPIRATTVPAALNTAAITALSRIPIIPKDDRPHRFEGKRVSIIVRCQRKQMDLAGLTDGKSLRIFLGKMSPRRTILLGASAEATDFLYNHLLLTLPGQDVVAPRALLECVNVTQSQLLLPAVISDELATTCRVAHLHGYELGRLQFKPSADKDTLLTADAPTSSLSQLMMIGDLKLPLIKRVLSTTDSALAFEFVAGDLHVFANQRRVAIVRKNDEGSISLEGEAGPEFVLIRKLLYQQLAIIH